MAIGDAAAAAGLPVVLSTDDLREGYNAINEVADAVATRTPLILVQPTEPTNVPVGTIWVW